MADPSTHVKIDWCVTLVNVKDSGNMDFVVVWNVTFLAGEHIRKRPDELNKKGIRGRWLK